MQKHYKLRLYKRNYLQKLNKLETLLSKTEYTRATIN